MKRVTMLSSVWVAAAMSAWATTADEVVALEVGSAIGVDGGGGGYLVIKDGKIESVGATGAPEGARVLSFDGAVACPGFIDVVTGLGGAPLDEPARVLMPELDAADAFAPGHSSFHRAAQRGVTTVGLCPPTSNLIGGTVAVVHTSNGEDHALLGGSGPLRMTLGGPALRRDRFPTSRMGAMHLLRKEVAAGLPGTGALLVHASSSDEIRLAHQLLASVGRPVAFTGATGGEDALRHLEGHQATFVLNAPGVATSRRAQRLPSLMAEAGHAVAFTAGGDADALRLGAALAVREGLSEDAALAAITSVPAAVLGLGDRAGSLAAGMRGDVVVFDGHPLDLSSRILAVIVGGKVVDLDDQD